MTGKRKALWLTAPLTVVVALAACLMVGAGSAWGAAQYEDDGAMQNALGGWDLPFKGECKPSNTNTISTKPECVATRFAQTGTACTNAGGALTSATSRYCLDGVSDNEGACVDEDPSDEFPNGIDRLWNPIESRCILTLKGYNRNQAVCQVQQGGTWTLWGADKCIGAWVMPASASATFTPPLYTSVTNPGPGDQCLRCHRSDTEWNTNRVRDVEGFLLTGHKNMARKVVATKPWAGPDGTVYPTTDNGSPFTWASSTVNVGWSCSVGGYTTQATCEAALGTWTAGTDQALYWIFGDWLAPLPRAVYDADPVAGTPIKPGMSYSCARCHTTGWTSDATIYSPTGPTDIKGKEPELSFPGITWDGVTGAVAGQVNLAGGVSGDTNKAASWDLYGITCSRCHGSSIEDADGSCSVTNLLTSVACAAGGGTWTAGLPAPAAFGRGATHHADVTNFDVVNGGYCTNLQLRNPFKYTCEYLSGTWYSACSDDRWQSETQCKTNSGCINPANNHGLNYTTKALCEAATAGECSIPVFTTSAPCTGGGGTWAAAANTWWTAKTPGTWKSSYCSIGTCSNATYTTQPTCVSNGGTWTNTWTDLFSCMDAGGKWTGNKERRGQLITSLCMDCHRQETGGKPYDSGTDPAGKLKVGPAHGTVDFVSHPHGNQFLNSPHAKFKGRFQDIPLAIPFGDGVSDYNSYFMYDGEAANTGNGCTGCHNVHESVVKETGQHHAIHEECTDCHAKNLNLVQHPKGTGTPLEHMGTEPAETCVACHMPGGLHLFRVNVDEEYSTVPLPEALTSPQNANTEPDGSYTSAVWVDLDRACGQCHGGGTGNALTTADTTAGSKVITVADAAGFVVGARVRVAGAGALEADGETRSDLETYIASVAGFEVTLAMGTSSVSITLNDADVEVNPVANGGGYMTKTALAGWAKGMHQDKPTVTFGYKLGSPNTLTVNVDASGSSCNGACDAYDWDWGDGTTPHGSGVTASHTYAAAGSKTITLTVEEYGVGGTSVTRTVAVYAPDLPPTAVANCTWDENAWTMTVDPSASTDDNGIKQVTVNWGDGTMLYSDTTAPFGATPLHTYLNPGSYTVTVKVIDTIGQQRVITPCTGPNAAAPGYFTISGTVSRSNGTTRVASAKVQVKKGATVVKTVYTAANGNFSAGSLKPDTYTLVVTKTSTSPVYTFPTPAPITVGPNSPGNAINATAP